MNWTLLQNSLLVSGATTLLAAGLGFLAALWLATLEARWRNVFLALAIVALALPPFLVTNCWLDLLGDTGALRTWLPLNIYSLGGAVWILALLLWPITTLAVWAAWQRLESPQLEADPAVTGWVLIRWLLLPLARPALGLAALLTFVLALNNFAVPAILQVKVFPAEVWVQFNTTLDTRAALQTSWLLIVAPLVLLLWLARRGIAWPRVQGTVSPRIFHRQLGAGWFWFSGAVTTALCLLSVGLPLIQLISSSRTWAELPSALAAGQSAIWNSFWFAAVAATICVGLGLAGGTLTRTRETRALPSCRNALCHFLWLPFLIPGVLMGIALIVVFNRPPFLDFYHGVGIVILAFVIRYFAIGWQGAARAMRATDPDLTDAARLDGASQWQLLRHVQWPQIAPQIVAAWYVVYLLCLWDVESLVLIIPPGAETLALRVFNLLHYGHNAQVNALCLALLALAVAPLLVVAAFVRARRFFASRNRNDFRRALTSAATMGVAIALLAGCSPQSAENEAPIESQFFSRVQIIGSRGVGVGQFNKPRSLAVDRDDNLYVADMTGRIQKFSPDGRYLLSWQMPQTDLGKPKGMARDAAGNIIVIEPHYQRVNHFTPEGKLVAQWGVSGTNVGQLKLPRAAAVNSRGEVFISEYGVVDRVQRFSADGKTLLAGFGHAGEALGEFNRPEGLCMNKQDQLCVADSCNHRIQIFSADGQLLRAFGKAGSGSGELSYPYDIGADAAGLFYVCEFGNSRIQIFDANGGSLEIIGGPGAEPGRFSNPWGVVLDSRGNLYVADSQNHRVQKFVRKS